MTISSHRILLREVCEDDFNDIHEYASDPAVVKFLSFGPNTKKDTRAYLAKILRQQKKRPRRHFVFAIVKRRDSRPASPAPRGEREQSEKSGSTGCEPKRAISKNEEKLIGLIRLSFKSFRFRKADLGYVLNRKYWGQGFMTEACRLMLPFGFKTLKLHRIIAHALIQNVKSKRILEKMGMKKEGLLRDNVFLRGRWRSGYLYSMLEHEFRKRQGKFVRG